MLMMIGALLKWLRYKKKEDYEYFMKRSQSWKNLFDWKQVLSDQRKTVVGTALSIPEK
jgi:hypothetical protein